MCRYSVNLKPATDPSLSLGQYMNLLGQDLSYLEVGATAVATRSPCCKDKEQACSISVQKMDEACKC